ncbi:MAG: hypothetical protein ABSF12_25020 [Bryobacteraceae bacterium]
MKKLMSTLFVVATAANMAMAADKPDFSGNWKLDADKSTFGPMPPPTSMTRKVVHKDPDLSVDQAQSGDQGDQNTSMKYSTDGKETTNSMMGNDVKSKAVWEGKTLVITSAANFGGADVKLTDKWSLSDDGKTLTDVLGISAPQGDFEMTFVLVKQ